MSSVMLARTASGSTYVLSAGQEGCIGVASPQTATT